MKSTGMSLIRLRRFDRSAVFENIQQYTIFGHNTSHGVKKRGNGGKNVILLVLVSYLGREQFGHNVFMLKIRCFKHSDIAQRKNLRPGKKD